MEKLKKPWLHILALVVFSFAVSFVLPTAMDQDPYLHFREAEQYRAHGIFDSSYAFLEWSAFRDHPSDLWYGHRMLLLPFSFIENPSFSIPLIAATFFSIFLVGIYLIFRHSGLRNPIFYIFLYVFSWVGIIGRMTTGRPFVLSTLLILLLFVLLSKRVKHWKLALVSFLLAWIHLSLIWVVPLIVGSVFIADLIYKQRPYFAGWAAITFGAFAGVFLRPQPLHGLKLLWIQIGEVTLAKWHGVVLPFGGEVMPFDIDSIYIIYLLPMLIMFIIGVVIFLRNNRSAIEKDKNVMAVSAMVIALIFIALTFGMAERSIDLAFLFATFFIGLVLSRYQSISFPITKIFAGLFVPMLLGTGITFVIFRLNGISLSNIKDWEAPSSWLFANAAQGNLLVASGQWDAHKVYYWNQKMHFLNFSDPIFMHVYDPGSNDKLKNYIWQENDRKITYTPDSVKDLCQSLQYFDTEYLLIDAVFYPKLVPALISSACFQEVYHEKQFFIFSVAHADK